MRRLYLTDDQSALVVAALRFYRNDLQFQFDCAMKSNDSEAADNINNIINRLDDVVDILTED